MRLGLIGDIGGHRLELHNALVGLGADEDAAGRLVLPEDLIVVQVGDLVHRGPDSAGVLELVAGIVDRQGEQWVQLAGNHEAMYLGGPQFGMPQYLDVDGQRLLHAWWESGVLRLAAGIVDDDLGEVLVTHAGLTFGAWNALGAPREVAVAVDRINAWPGVDPERAWRPGRMLGGEGPSLSAGPVWAEAGGELYASWRWAESMGDAAPFAQVHGHSSAFWWAKRQFTCDERIVDRLRLDRARRHVIGEFAGRAFFGIDASLGVSAGVRWGPLLLRGELVAR